MPTREEFFEELESFTVSDQDAEINENPVQFSEEGPVTDPDAEDNENPEDPGEGMPDPEEGDGQTTVRYMGGPNIKWNEVPTGDIDGVNNTFALSKIPTNSNNMLVYLNGLLQRLGSDYDFLVDGQDIIFNVDAIPLSGDYISVTYQFS